MERLWITRICYHVIGNSARKVGSQGVGFLRNLAPSNALEGLFSEIFNSPNLFKAFPLILSYLLPMNHGGRLKTTEIKITKTLRNF